MTFVMMQAIMQAADYHSLIGEAQKKLLTQLRFLNYLEMWLATGAFVIDY